MHILAKCSRTVRAVSTCIFCSWDNINHTCSPIVSNWSVFSAAQRKVNLLLLTKRLCDKTNRPIKAEENCFLYSSTVPVMLCTRVNKHTCFRLLHKETQSSEWIHMVCMHAFIYEVKDGLSKSGKKTHAISGSCSLLRSLFRTSCRVGRGDVGQRGRRTTKSSWIPVTLEQRRSSTGALGCIMMSLWFWLPRATTAHTRPHNTQLQLNQTAGLPSRCELQLDVQCSPILCPHVQLWED